MSEAHISYEISRSWTETASNEEKQLVLDDLLRRFGSRRAIIEELDRLKRLSLLKPAGGSPRFDHEGNRIRSTGVQNVPNPQWREIDTPSLLISGERISQATTLISVTTVSANKINRVCKGCGGHLDEITPNCITCKLRHKQRASNSRRKG